MQHFAFRLVEIGRGMMRVAMDGIGGDEIEEAPAQLLAIGVRCHDAGDGAAGIGAMDPAAIRAGVERKGPADGLGEQIGEAEHAALDQHEEIGRAVDGHRHGVDAAGMHRAEQRARAGPARGVVRVLDQAVEAQQRAGGGGQFEPADPPLGMKLRIVRHLPAHIVLIFRRAGAAGQGVQPGEALLLDTPAALAHRLDEAAAIMELELLQPGHRMVEIVRHRPLSRFG